MGGNEGRPSRVPPDGKLEASPRRSLCYELQDRVLLNCAADLGKHVIGIGADEPDRAHDNYKNHSQHHCVFRNVLTTLIIPKLL